MKEICFIFTFKIRLIDSRKYWKAKNLVPVLKGVISRKFYFDEILTTIQTQEKRLNFQKNIVTRFRENFDFRGFIVMLISTFD